MPRRLRRQVDVVKTMRRGMNTSRRGQAEEAQAAPKQQAKAGRADSCAAAAGRRRGRDGAET